MERPSNAALRRFGLEMAAALIVLFNLLPGLLSGRWHWWPWAAGVVLAAMALLVPRALGPVQQAWLRLGHALGWVNSRILLSVLFFGVLTPTGVARRWLGYDPLRRGKDPQAPTYREPVEKRDPKHMERPF